MIGWHVRKAFPALDAVTRAGVVIQEAEDDKAIRRHYFNPTLTNVPSLAWSAAYLAGRAPPRPTSERWINYYGPPGFLPDVSYFELFEPDAAARLGPIVSNRVVFVGAKFSDRFAGGMETDDFHTPYTRWSNQLSPGVEINATCFLNLVRQDWLRRLPAGIEAIAILLMGLALGLTLGRLHPVVATGLGLSTAAVVILGAIGCAWFARLWLPWTVVVLVQLPLVLIPSFLGQSRRLLREKRAFEQALALASEGRGTTAPLGSKKVGPAASPGGPDPVGSEPVPIPEFLRESGAPDKRDDLPRVPDHELLRRIGSGGYGEVWLARDILGSLHAVKLLRLGSFANAGPMRTEFEGLRKFTPISRSHPGLVHVLHVGRDEARACLFYVMELADDELVREFNPATYAPRTLARELARRGRLPLPEVLSMGVQLADALEHLHRNRLVHRDVKPANIVFVKGETKLADVGLVTETISDGDGLSFLGTPGRIAPEGAGTPAADVFSLGKVLYEAGFGMNLDRFPELPLDMIGPGASRDLFELNRIIMKACDLDFRRRHGSAGELRDALAALQRRFNRAPVSS
jgi:hypothetical protein